MGKYDKIIERLQKLPLDQSYQQRVDEEKAKIKKRTPGYLAAAYNELRDEKDAWEQVIKDCNLRIEAHAQLIEEAYENAGIRSLKLDSGPSISVQDEPTAVVEDKEAFRLWCIENGLENSLALHSRTANSLTKERLLAGKTEPEGIRAYVRTKIVRKA